MHIYSFLHLLSLPVITLWLQQDSIHFRAFPLHVLDSLLDALP